MVVWPRGTHYVSHCEWLQLCFSIFLFIGCFFCIWRFLSIFFLQLSKVSRDVGWNLSPLPDDVHYLTITLRGDRRVDAGAAGFKMILCRFGFFSLPQKQQPGGFTHGALLSTFFLHDFFSYCISCRLTSVTRRTHLLHQFTPIPILIIHV